MPKTRNELAVATLEELQVVGADEPADASDLNVVLGAMDSVFADLVARNVIFWGIGADIDDAQFEHLACILAKRVAPRFGRGADAVVISNAATADDALRTIARINRGTRKTLGVDAGLLQRRRYSFTRISN